MPNTKSSDIRYQVLDRCWRRGGYSTEELMKAVNEALEFHGHKPVTSANTIRNDRLHLETAYPHIEVVEKRIGRNITYGYADPNSSIYKVQLNDEEMGQLSQCMAMLSRFEGLPQMDWLKDFMERFRLSIDIETGGKCVVGFDTCEYLKGKEHFATILRAITEKKLIKLVYKSFSSGENRVHIVSPYYIKEYNKRWFFLGRTADHSTPTTFALDRIVSIEYAEDGIYIENTQIDFNNEYFEDVIGVTRYNDRPAEVILLKVKSKRLPYIMTKPLHGSQKVLSREEDAAILQIEVIPNFELEQLLLSYGSDISVMAPKSLHEKLKGEIQEMSKNYE